MDPGEIADAIDSRKLAHPTIDLLTPNDEIRRVIDEFGIRIDCRVLERFVGTFVTNAAQKEMLIATCAHLLNR